MRRLRHITSTTGDVAFSGRSSVSDQAVAALLPLVNAAGGSVPTIPGLYVDLWRGGAGAAAYQIAGGRAGTEAGRLPYVMGAMCWDESAGAGAWEQAQTLHTATTVGLDTPWLGGNNPPKPPWMTASAGVSLITAPLDLLPVMGDLERCLFWACVESAGATPPTPRAERPAVSR